LGVELGIVAGMEVFGSNRKYLAVVVSQNPELNERVCFLKFERADLKKHTKRVCFFQFECLDVQKSEGFFQYV